MQKIEHVKKDAASDCSCIRIDENGCIHAGAEILNCLIGSYTEIGAWSTFENTEFGSFSYTGESCILQNCIIGKFSNIAAHVRIGPTKHPVNRVSLHHFTYRRRRYGFSEHDDEEFFAWRKEQISRIGHDTWLGHGAVIMPGVSIGTGSVIGAGAVVTKDIPAYSIAVGVPAAVIRRRFSLEQERKLMDIAWWDWPCELIRDRLEDFSLSADEFIERYSAADR